jgi:hypothetical protein
MRLPKSLRAAVRAAHVPIRRQRRVSVRVVSRPVERVAAAGPASEPGSPAFVVPPKSPRPAAVQRWIDGPAKPETPGYSVHEDYVSPGRTYGVRGYEWRSKASRNSNPLAPNGCSIFGSDWD